MGRSSGEPAGIDPSDDGQNSIADVDGKSGRFSAFKSMGAAQRQVFENVRRALGKLVSHTKVNRIDLHAASPVASPGHRNVLEIDVPLNPAAANSLSILVTDHHAGIPHVDPGGGGVDLAAVVTVVSANSALGATSTQVYQVNVDYSHVGAPELSADLWTVQEAEVLSLNTSMPGGDVYEFPIKRTRTVALGALPVDPVIVRAGTRFNFASALRPPRVETACSIQRAYLAPMRRHSSILRRGPGLNMEERERLAAFGKTEIENIALIGLFRNIPVTAVSRLSVDEEAAELSIWLKPDAISSAAPPKMVTLLIGRDISTGKMIQTVAS